MPALCQAGVLVECCTPSAPVQANVAGQEGPCAEGCAGDGCDREADETNSPDRCECEACLEACNVVAPKPEDKGNVNVALMPVAAIEVVQVRGYAELSRQYYSFGVGAEVLDANLPYPISDRPLLI